MNTYQDFHRIPDYKNPQVTGISRLPAHTRFGAFASEEEALRGSIYDSSNLMLLDGTWRFRLYEKPEETELYYLRSRYYKWRLVKFINADVIIANCLFAYCCNNPITHQDHSGRTTVSIAT